MERAVKRRTPPSRPWKLALGRPRIPSSHPFRRISIGPSIKEPRLRPLGRLANQSTPCSIPSTCLGGACDPNLPIRVRFRDKDKRGRRRAASLSATAGRAEGTIPSLTLRLENDDGSGGSRERQERARRVPVTFTPWRRPGLPHELSISAVQCESVHSMVFAGGSRNSALPPGCGH